MCEDFTVKVCGNFDAKGMENSNHQPTSMYGSGGMNMQQNLDEEEDVPGGGTGGGGEESVDNPQIGYQESGGVATVMNNGMEEASPANFYGQGSDLAVVPGNAGVDQLTLSFQGEVYVFDSVSPDKVRLNCNIFIGFDLCYLFL